jgi:S-adenosylmethionine synthetase
VTKRNTVTLVDVIITHGYEVRFAREATVATNKVTIFGRLHHKYKVDRTPIDLGGDRHAGYPNSVLVHVADNMRMQLRSSLWQNHTNERERQ